MFSFIPGDAAGTTVQVLADWWIAHCQEYHGTDESTGGISLTHPTVFELIGLPKNYDTLMEETMKRRCPTTGKDVSDPILCLFCGEIFCGQSICCLKEGPERRGRRAQQIGGGQQHMLKSVSTFPLFPCHQSIPIND
jgi:E3 ubiquitin-protein ligase UBR1